MSEGAARVAASLRQIEGAVRRLDRHALLAALRPAVAVEQVRSALAVAGMHPCADLEELYAWSDGTSIVAAVSADDLHLLPGFYLLSLDDALLTYRSMASDGRWPQGWLPILANGGGDFLALDLSVPGVCPVRHFRIDEAEHPVEFTSLERMLDPDVVWWRS